MSRILKCAAAVSVICVAAACTSGGSLNDPASATAPTSSSPTPPTGPPTETFSGSLGLAGTNFHNFTTTQAGDIDVALPTTAPSTSSIVLLGLGVQSADASGCTLKYSYLVVFAKAGPGLALPAAVSLDPGAYCIAVEDQFRAGPLTYTVNVWHH